MKAVLVTTLAAVASFGYAQKIERSPDLEISQMNSAQVDMAMTEVANVASQSTPIRADEITVVQRVIYLKPMRTLLYQVSLIKHRDASAVAATMRPSFCSGRTNRAFMSKGVTYKYAVTTPKETYSITFAEGDC